jgi:hypothetical protein
MRINYCSYRKDERQSREPKPSLREISSTFTMPAQVTDIGNPLLKRQYSGVSLIKPAKDVNAHVCDELVGILPGNMAANLSTVNLVIKSRTFCASVVGSGVFRSIMLFKNSATKVVTLRLVCAASGPFRASRSRIG